MKLSPQSKSSIAALHLQRDAWAVLCIGVPEGLPHALGIFGLGKQAKKASSFLVMAVVGGPIVPKM